METYVVRVYREPSAEHGELVGVVEHVGVEGQVAFRNVEQLVEVLISRPTKRRSSSPEGEKRCRRQDRQT
ncbi:MAG: hypothetical protein HZB55_15640 [Deltaproteobacteria bacterium]|nr:hypothetical protein [Deltaproteobacteria bacterium]